jgi:hypothetical protein
MRYLVFILLSALTVFGESPYNQIAKRNAFDLTEKKPSAILPPVHLVLTDVYLTGVARKAKIYTAYMAIKGTTQNKFLGLREGQQKDGIEVIKITKDTVFISRNGILQELTFQQNSLPSTVTKISTKSNTKDKSGQSKIKSDIDSNERRRQYDEWRKNREKGR